MKVSFYLFLSHFIIFYKESNYGTEALVGQNVERVRHGEFLYVGSLMHRTPLHRIGQRTYHICTVVLVTRRHVLTAAHCLDNTLSNATQVVIGSSMLTHGIIYYPLWYITYNAWVAHMNIQMEFRVNDIGVSKLTEAVHEDIEPAAITDLRNSNFYGRRAWVASWGLTDNGRAPIGLRAAKLRVLPNEKCEDRIENFLGRRIPVHARHLCSAANPFVLMHFGDSGGPLLRANTIIGINKSTIPYPNQPLNPRKVNIHVGIEYYREFILATIHDNFEWS